MNTLFDQNNPEPQSDLTKEAIIAKWKDKPREELENAKAESDLYIQTILRRQDEINKDYRRVLDESKAQAKLQELIDRFETLPINRQDTTTPVNDLERTPYDPSQLKSLMQETIREDVALRKSNENFLTVQKRLKEQFGDNYTSVLQKQMDSLELTSEDIDNLARKSPNAFFNTLGLNPAKSEDNFQAPPRSQRNDSFASQGTKKRTWSYYQEMKKTNPDLYMNSKIANQMHDDMVALGDDFKDGDWNS